jgi:hypothetical protein
MKKTIKIEYFLLPKDDSHLQDVLYRTFTPKPSEWILNTIPIGNFKRFGIKRFMELFASNLNVLMLGFKATKVKSFECKLVRKNGRKNTKKNKSKECSRSKS